MKFEYSPGLLGYGAKGTDGSAGLQGLALYFTDYDPVSDILSIRNAIENNEVLWRAGSGVNLPGNRVYQSGDLFISQRGFVYEIDAENDTYSDEKGQLSKVEYFSTNGIKSGAYDYERWFNIQDPCLGGATGKFIIDNNKSSESNYLAEPLTLYGIYLKNFNRVEYTDGSAFSVYSTGSVGTNDKSIALFRDNNTFKFGNITASNTIPNTNLTFDVSLLQHKREASNMFTINMPSQTVLTSSEKNPYSIFDPNFTKNPGGFQNYTSNADQITINWNLRDFTSDTDVKGDLYFEKCVSTNSYSILDASRGKPIILHNVDVSGSVTFEQCQVNQTYTYYMMLSKDGWERSSTKNKAVAGSASFYISVLDPALKTLTANYLGYFTQNSSYHYLVDLSTYVLNTWNASVGSNSWIIMTPSAPNGSTGTYLNVIDVSLSRYSGTTARAGNIILSAQSATDVSIAVIQNPLEITASFTNDGSIVFSPALTDQNLTVNVQLNAWARAKGTWLSGRWADTFVSSYKDGVISVNKAEAHAESHGSFDEDPNSGFHSATNSISNVGVGTKIQIRISGNGESTNGPDCDWDSTERYEEGIGYAYISSISKISGTGNISIVDASRYWYFKRLHTSCANQLSAASSAPTIPARV